MAGESTKPLPPLKGIVHNNSYNDNANPEGLYVHEDRSRVMIDGKSANQYYFAVLSSKENKNKLPPMFNVNFSNVIIDVLPINYQKKSSQCVPIQPQKINYIINRIDFTCATKRNKANSMYIATDASGEIVDNEACTNTKDTNDNTFWDSPGARHLFGYMNPVNYEEKEEGVEAIVVTRIEALYNAHLDEEGYKVL